MMPSPGTIPRIAYNLTVASEEGPETNSAKHPAGHLAIGS